MDTLNNMEHRPHNAPLAPASVAPAEFRPLRLGGEVYGIASVAERMLILMDIEALMSSADMGLMDVHPSVQ